jgi:Coenzyme PQQ synthesis protein D (PqqD)
MRVQRNPSVEMAPMKSETVLYNPDNNKFCVLNVTAAFLWEELESPKTSEELLAALLGNFSDIEEATASADVGRVLEEFLEVKCLDRVD